MSVIERNHIYRGKKPKRVPRAFGDYYDDRMVLYVSATQVQYDSPTVRTGRHYPMVSRERFEKWMGEDVTKGYKEREDLSGWEKYDRQR